MKRTLFLLITAFSFTSFTTEKILEDVCLTAEEYKLYKLIMEYRAENDLGEIPLSKSMTIVAKAHARDLQKYSPDRGRCNMHSWSDKGDWTSCCYTPDHKKASCMWLKPQELTNYTGYGYEIAHWSSANVTAEGALISWKGSSGHNEVIINKGLWKKEWKAIGIGISKNYAIIWFGHETDPDGEAGACNQ